MVRSYLCSRHSLCLTGQRRHLFSFIAADLHAKDIACMGVTTFRASFINWDSETGVPFHNINMWQDKRTKAMVKSWNDSLLLKLLKKGSGLLHAITGSQRFKAGYAIKFLCNTVSIPSLEAVLHA